MIGPQEPKLTAEQAIAARRYMEETVANPVFVRCFSGVKWFAIREMADAGSNEDRIKAQALYRACERLETEMQIVRDDGAWEIKRIADASLKK